MTAPAQGEFEHDWKPSPCTSPSGKLLYHCEWCGLYDPAPVKTEFERRPCVHDKYVHLYEVTPKGSWFVAVAREQKGADRP